MSKISYDFVVPCGRPETERARKMFKCLSVITKNTKSKIIIVGNFDSSIKNHYPENFVWINTPTLLWPAANRNKGAKISDKQIIIFIDDDCYIEEGVMEEVKRIFSCNDGLALLGGRITSNNPNYVSRSLDYTCFTYQQKNKSHWNRDLIASAFMCVNRKLFDKLGGFDESLRVREDIDFVRRVLSSGHKTLYTPDIVIRHDHGRDTWREYYKHMHFSGGHPYSDENKEFIVEYSKYVHLRSIIKRSIFKFHILLFPMFIIFNLMKIYRENIRSIFSVTYHIFGIIFGLLAYEISRIKLSLERYKNENI